MVCVVYSVCFVCVRACPKCVVCVCVCGVRCFVSAV